MIRGIILGLAFIAAGCNLTDTFDESPAYLLIDEVSINTTEEQGAPTHNIEDVWVYADGQILGVFPLPARVPILTTGEEMEIIVEPGIRNNGENSRAFFYNLMNDIVFTRNLQPGELVERDFVFTYNENAKFDFVEGFESSNVFSFALDDDPETELEVVDTDFVSGSKSGYFYLTDENPRVQVATEFVYKGENNSGSDSYFEMEYKCTMNFVVGIRITQDGVQQTIPVIELRPSEEWNKIYIDFTDLLSSPAIIEYQPFIGADISVFPITEGEVWLDNLKFVHL